MPDFYHDNRFFVTGGGGFLGSHIVRTLKKRGAYVVAPTRAECDLRKRDETYDALTRANPTVVIHAAGNVGGIGYNQTHPAELFTDNLMMGVNLIDACSWKQINKLVLIGTVCSYPASPRLPFVEADFWNGYPESTNAPYGIAKKALLTMAQAYRAQYGLKSIYLVPTNLYGEGDHFEPERSHVIPALIRRFVEGKASGATTVTVWGTGAATREFLHVRDAANAILLAAERYDGAEPVNIGGGEEYTIYALVNWIALYTGYTGEIVWDATKPDGQPARALDCTFAQQAFGFAPTVAFTDGLKRMVDWYMEMHREPERA